jgi:DNA polymerase
LTAYLQYQRDIGVDTIVFERASAAVKTVLGGAGRAVNKYGGGYSRAAPTSAISTASAPKPKVAAGGYSARLAAVGNAASGGAPDSPFSKLAKLRPVDTVELRKFERPAPPPAAPVNSAKREKLAALYRQTLNCEACALSKGRVKVIFGSGSADVRVFVVGGAPYPRDEASGLPFQGEIGELFDKILSKMGLDRKRDIFATYAQKCRHIIPKTPPQAVENHSLNQQSQYTQQSLFSPAPEPEPDNQGGGPNNQDNGFEPQYAEVCRTILDGQIEIIEPKVILVFGREPANFILENGCDIEKLRGMYHIYKDIPLVATYGLPLMLKETQYRSGAWEDIKKAMNYSG